MKHCFLLVAAVLSCAAIDHSYAADVGDAGASAGDMQQKLEHSSRILAGLVTEDFEKIRDSAAALNRLGKRKWIEHDTAAYRMHNQVFWFTTGTLMLAAESKNLEGATLAYTQMTLSCVNCHRLLRSQ